MPTMLHAPRVALIYDDSVRPETTGYYCLRALRSLCRVTHIRPAQLKTLVETDFDLFLQVDDGLHYRVPDRLRPSAVWVIDTHMDLESACFKATTADFAFAAQRDGAEQLQRFGIDAEWLALAADPEMHAPRDVPLTYDVCFVGNRFPGRRNDLIELIRSRVPNTFIGRRYFDAMAETYSASRVVFNCSLKNDVNMRVFEAVSCGGVLLTNAIDKNGQEALFEDWVHLVTYRDNEEMLQRISWLLDDEAARHRIAAAGRAEILHRHTYRHRMQRVLQRAFPENSLLTSISNQENAMTEPTIATVKDSSYFEHSRPEILERVPSDARCVLDVGCGTGRLGAALKQRQNCEVWGIERDAAAAARAEARLDRVLQKDAEEIATTLIPETFDAVICGDVLEHLRDPLGFLRKLRLWLKPDGRIIVSLPNVRHHSVIRSLLEGNWTYESAGLLDDDHLRFFTRREIEKLFYRAGFGIDRMDVIPGSGYDDWRQSGRPMELRVGGLTYRARDERDAEDLFAYQYLVEAAPQLERSTPLTSIIIVTDNQCDFTRGCIESLRYVTDEPYELIIVDNGSTDDTIDYLHSIRGATVIANDDHRGFAAAANQGLDAARGEFVLFLNNDTLLTTGWLRRMLEALQSDPAIGITGPMANRTNGVQRVDADYSLAELDGFAWDYGDRNRGRRYDVDQLAAICLLARRDVLEQMGGFAPERDANVDLCRRVRQAGYRVTVTGDAFVHHFGQNRLIAQAGEQDGFKVPPHDRAPQNRQPDDDGLSETAPVSMEEELTSIVIVTHNQLRHTKKCVNSIRRHTNARYELIFVDNGSNEETVAYLESLTDVTLIKNADNRGFPAAANQGLAAARGEYLLLLNNDTLVTDGWLGRLQQPMRQDPQIGLVGPLSNRVSGEQQIPVDYKQTSGLARFAARLAEENAGQRTETDRLVGFCLLTRRAVVDRIGDLDERFGIGNFEDDDFCRRALNAGFRAVIARDAFVHHVGSATFRATKVNFRKLLKDNRRKFQEKWKHGNDSGPGNGDVASGPAAQQSSDRLRLSLCMIVRNNETTIGPALESIKPWVDEMIVVDTGSTDATPDICRNLGARVEHFAWCDDFSAARNESLKYATGEWIFWMDSDDTIPEDCGRRLRELADGEHPPSRLGYVMQVHCPSAEHSDDMTVVDHVKLFRNRPDLRFEHRIHEQILPAISRAGGDVEFTDLYVVHSGSDHSAEGRQRKLERDYKLLRLDLQERPDHPFVLFNLGMTYADDDRHSLAIQYLSRCIQVSHPNESHVRKAFALLMGAQLQDGRIEDADQSAREALQRYPHDKELLFRRGQLLREMGRLQEAVDTYRRVIDEPVERHFASVDAGLTGHKARHNLATTLLEMKRYDEAATEWRLITQERPGFRSAWAGLAEIALDQQDDEAVAALLEQMPASGASEFEVALLQARRQERSGDWPAAVQTLEACLERHGTDRAVLDELCRVQFERIGPVQAEPRLKQLAELDPASPSAKHNLGVVALKTDRPEAAVELLERSVELRPNSAPTWQLLGHARQRSGREHEAAAAWEQARRLDAGLDLALPAKPEFSTSNTSQAA